MKSYEVEFTATVTRKITLEAPSLEQAVELAKARRKPVVVAAREQKPESVFETDGAMLGGLVVASCDDEDGIYTCAPECRS